MALGGRSLLACVRLRSSVGFITLTVSLAVFTDMFLYGIVIPVIPFALTSRIDLEATEVQTWLSVLLAVYGAAMFCASPVCGWATDRIRSRRTFLLAGLIALGAATALLLVARSLTLIIVARALQGVSAAVVWVAGPALLADSVDPDQIGYFMGFMGDSMGLAVLAAPAVGGVVYERVGYDAVFYICLGLIGLDMLFRLLVIEKQRPEEVEGYRNERRSGSVHDNNATTTTQEGSLPSRVQEFLPEEKASVESSISDDDDGNTVTNVKNWRGRSWPLFTLLLSPRLATDLFGCMIQATLFTSIETILPSQVRQTFHWGSLGAGLVFLPLTLPALTSPFVGWIADRHRARLPCIMGFALAAPSFVLLRFVTDSTVKDKIVLCCLVTIVGLALTLVLIPLMADIIHAVNSIEAEGKLGPCTGGAYGQAYALFNMAYAAGSTIGPLLSGLLKARMGWEATTLALGCISGASILPIALWVGTSNSVGTKDNESIA
ncbi:MFS general substrate transporter [Aureobasidium pullulans]|uniref:MFS general substrate transporter n=1 Tax=Aureobasidium pullulans TaxID=5580 RepID=A0A4T0BMS7_AURPU|nr:MFS general substrate transporter [Aureobasidium pullulans]